MKRQGNLWRDAISFGSLLRAAGQARRGKRFRPAVAAFDFDLEHELWSLHDELSAKTYRPGPYHTFFIREPKPRLISAAPYRDRVVHHALTRCSEPLALAAVPLTRLGSGRRETISDRPRNDVQSVCPRQIGPTFPSRLWP